jgi:hypothetical protein
MCIAGEDFRKRRQAKLRILRKITESIHGKGH